MVKRLGVFGARTEVVEAMHAVDHQNAKSESPKASHDVVPPAQTLSVGSTDWTPDQAEQYIDWRLQNLDSEIASLRGQLDERLAMRKRWLAVTGGRSKIGNGNGNGISNGNGNGGSNGSGTVPHVAIAAAY